MPEIIIYTSNLCPYCTMAKRLLSAKGATYTELNVDTTPGLREEMVQKTRRRTVPQIYIGEQHIGGFDDLRALDLKKGLDPLLVLR
ncbi:glutaredoxin [Methyloprofundus sedimenti]|uniref:Glutaredoxin n=1 Tax=Methyloprofundus sedimenti TaxID=1420851 RepID=A0A1V8M0V3_9GAMM|nr:glutaredoxin 3 [Methyloprofundus sedimenti]OQK15136.1 glutaredoxin [Methyloprofundus sedimenti]